MDSKRRQITRGILAVLAATVVACGSIQGATGQTDPARGGGTSYLTADENYGSALLQRDNTSGPSAASGDNSGPLLQP